MARVFFRIRVGDGKKPVSIKVRLSLNRSQVFELKTGFSILPEDWSDKTKLPKYTDEFNKKLHNSLKILESYLYSQLNEDLSNATIINTYWLEKAINNCFNRVQTNDNGLLINHIQHIIDNAATRKVKKAGRVTIGLSANTIKNYKIFKKMMLRYEQSIRKQIAFIDIDSNFVDKLTNWLRLDQNYSVNYSGKILDMLKTVSIDAADCEIPVHRFAKTIQHFRASDEDRFIQTFSLNELSLIHATEMPSKELENIKKWILIGCAIGQRGGDLLNVTKSQIRCNEEGRYFVDVIQQKGGKHVTCGVLDSNVTEIFENDFPWSVSDIKLNDGIKEVCKIVGINEIVEGYKLDNKINRIVFGKYPKYDLMASHCFRRSYATNHYKYYPTSVLMNTTGHSKESTFLAYINKRQDKDSNANLFMDLFEKLQYERIPQLKVVHSK